MRADPYLYMCVYIYIHTLFFLKGGCLSGGLGVRFSCGFQCFRCRRPVIDYHKGCRSDANQKYSPGLMWHNVPDLFVFYGTFPPQDFLQSIPFTEERSLVKNALHSCSRLLALSLTLAGTRPSPCGDL